MTIVLCGFLVAVGIHFVLGAYYQFGYPENTFLYKPNDASEFVGIPGAHLFGVHLFGDFFQAWHQTGQPSPYVDPNPLFRSNYPPFAHLLLKPFSFMEFRWAVLSYLTLLAVAMFALVYRALPGRGVARFQSALVLSLLTYPFLFLLDRANIDGFAVLFIWWAFVVRHERWWASPVLVGLAGAVKIYPGAFVLVYVQQRRWREVAVTVSTAGLTTLVALLTFAGGPIQGVQDFIKGVQGFTGPASRSNAQFVQHTASLISASKGLVHLEILSKDAMEPLHRLNLALTLLLVAALVLLPMKLWQQLFLVCTLITVLMETTYDYRLVFYLIPLIALILDEESPGRLATFMLVVMAMIMIPKSEPYLYDDVTIGVFINPLLVLTGSLTIIASSSRGRLHLVRRLWGPSQQGELEQAA